MAACRFLYTLNLHYVQNPSPVLSLFLLSSLHPCPCMCSSRPMLKCCVGCRGDDEVPYRGFVSGFEPFHASTSMSSSSDCPFEELCIFIDSLSRLKLCFALHFCAHAHFIMFLWCCLICSAHVSLHDIRVTSLVNMLGIRFIITANCCLVTGIFYWFKILNKNVWPFALNIWESNNTLFILITLVISNKMMLIVQD